MTAEPEGALAAAWPLAGLSLRTPNLELVFPDDQLALDLLALVEEGIHEPGESPFNVAFAERPSPEREQRLLQWWWGHRASWSPEKWWHSFAVKLDGEVIGVQDLLAEHFGRLRSVETGSWLVRRAQRRGFGTDMREAVLALAFDGLGAIEAHSSAFVGNASSIAVSRRLGYVDNGEQRALCGEVADRALCFLLTRERFEQHRSIEVEIVGLEACLEGFGLAADGSELRSAE